jgi:hypothetical protein
MLLQPILALLEANCNVPGQIDKYIPVTSEVTSKQDSLAAIVQTILIKIGFLMEATISLRTVNLVIGMFKQHEDVTEAGLLILVGLASGCPQLLELNEICKYLKHALDSKEGTACRYSCGVISDLAYGRPETIADYLADYVPALMTLLSDGSIDRDIKVHSLRAIGDLTLNCGVKYSEHYLQYTT